MEDIFQRLEKKIKELITQHNSLKNSNLQLGQYKSGLAREKDAILARQQKAITQIESLVAKLKAIEKIP